MHSPPSRRRRRRGSDWSAYPASAWRRSTSLRNSCEVEGFTDVQYVKLKLDELYKAFASGDVDISMAYAPPFIIQIDAGEPIVLLGGVHVGCFELFGTDRVRAIRDLKGKTVAIPALGSPHHVFLASMAAYVGIDPRKDINWVTHPVADSMRLLADRKIDAYHGLPAGSAGAPGEKDRARGRQQREPIGPGPSISAA